ncbi:hypothetical protein BGW36DRAFT_465466 [Talaromyces proteolyticus]|uniref:Zn(2)-C6 fungal-type domain-containing protein n=1 Tax=Talaromyces proteolyticus TaxID=1131652 RepID=A0AAD4KF61_9EURO|nr:uncharacterized protein BGW36DRAFT_465466 [Talaromyces proteolyticus]KAH8690552.1 hypothetical protein BGW36DRAFT_465466 [Talaromyces proteolyticus]
MTTIADTSRMRKPRACIPCHERKVRCNASHTGLPCTRCIQHERVAVCELVPLPDRSIARLKARKRQASDRRIEQQPPAIISKTASQSDLTDFVPAACGLAPITTCTTPELRELSVKSKGRDQDTSGVAEEDCQLETCLKMAQTEDERTNLTFGTSTSRVREIFAYHGGIDPTTILGQVLSDKKPRRYIKIPLREPPNVGNQSGSCLDIRSTAYLQSIGALDIPPSSTCQKLVRLYFERVFPYVPVLDRVSFMRKLSEGTCSIFLLQCILTSVTPYMSIEMLLEAGYSDRTQAQRELFSKAQLLYDHGAERSQLHLLQGSLVLTASYFSFGLDKDCRFWLSNAVRLATQMGLHRKQIVDQLDDETKRLFVRIFWAMYSRDVIMVMGGRVNVRALDERYIDMVEVTEEDWEYEPEHQLAHYGLSPVSALQKSYLVHSSRLARICAQYIELFRRPGEPPPRNACRKLEEKIFHWRIGLPPELQFETVDNWSPENVWVLLLRAMGYRLECFLYRDMRLLLRSESDSLRSPFLQKQQSAMLELDSIIHRIMLYDLVGFFPLSMTTCASTVIAMHIECALSAYSSDTQRQWSQTSIHSGLAYLRASLQNWDSVRWSLRMLDVIVSRSRLSLAAPEHRKKDLPPVRSCRREEATGENQTAGLSTTRQETSPTLILEEPDAAWASMPITSIFSAMEPEFTFESIPPDVCEKQGFSETFVEDVLSSWD